MMATDLSKSQVRALKLLYKKPRVVSQKADGARIPSPTAKSLMELGLAEYSHHVEGKSVDAGRRVIAITSKGVNVLNGHEV